MPTIRVKNENVPANATLFPLQGSQYEYLPFPAQISMAIVASAPGIVVDAFSGSDLLQQNGPATVKAGSPVFPEDFLLTDVARAGERISVTIRETAGVATTDVETVVIITPLV